MRLIIIIFKLIWMTIWTKSNINQNNQLKYKTNQSKWFKQLPIRFNANRPIDLQIWEVGRSITQTDWQLFQTPESDLAMS